MRSLLVACLLIGTISGAPVWEASRLNAADTNYKPQPPPGWWESADQSSSSALASPSSQSSAGAPQETAPGVGGYNHPGVSSSSHRAEGPGVIGAYTGSFGSYASPNEGAGPSRFVSEPREENWSSGSATNSGVKEESSEPVFSDVSDLEPVYSFSSRSSYQRGRVAFAQSRYTPGEPVFPSVPVRRAPSKTPSKQSSPAKAAPKGGF